MAPRGPCPPEPFVNSFAAARRIALASLTHTQTNGLAAVNRHLIHPPADPRSPSGRKKVYFRRKEQQRPTPGPTSGSSFSRLRFQEGSCRAETRDVPPERRVLPAPRRRLSPQARVRRTARAALAGPCRGSPPSPRPAVRRSRRRRRELLPHGAGRARPGAAGVCSRGAGGASAAVPRPSVCGGAAGEAEPAPGRVAPGLAAGAPGRRPWGPPQRDRSRSPAGGGAVSGELELRFASLRLASPQPGRSGGFLHVPSLGRVRPGREARR